MAERKTFESLHVDLRKKEFLLNGNPMEMAKTSGGLMLTSQSLSA